ncbi:hypothetical protein BaRGS_00037409 [Batillaria attramentaria]|uniref:Uncharacterized protein n=1 Tax=Batillaria attramentaria TaxID=370345 RepID=A0ABD0J8Z8_9CAEN
MEATDIQKKLKTIQKSLLAFDVDVCRVSDIDLHTKDQTYTPHLHTEQKATRSLDTTHGEKPHDIAVTAGQQRTDPRLTKWCGQGLKTGRPSTMVTTSFWPN